MEQELQEYITQTYPVLDYTVDTEDMTSGAQYVLSVFLPHWDLSKLHLNQFTDGLTNKLYKVVGNVETTPKEGQQKRKEKAALVRIYGKKTEILIDRERETRNLICLAREGLVPPLYGRFNNGICYGYVEGIPFSVPDMKHPEKSRLVAARMAQFHNANIVGERVPTLFTTIRKWLGKIPSSYPDPDKDARFKKQFSIESAYKELQFLEEELIHNTTEQPVVCFCHNDLLSGNIIYQPANVPQGTEARVAFIDLEYSSFNYRAHDIGNHFSEMMGYTVDPSLFPSKEFQLSWLRSYLETSNKLQGVETAVTQEDLEKLYNEVRRFSICAHFHWGIWALVQGRYSDNAGFDYINYSNLLLNAYRKRKADIFPEHQCYI